MKCIDLKRYYPDLYQSQEEIEVEDAIAQELELQRLKENAHRKRIDYHGAYFSLNCNDQIEKNVLFPVLTPEEFLCEEIMLQQLNQTLDALSVTQERRIRAYFFEGLSMTEIARNESVSKSRISESIQRGLLNLKKYLEIF